MPNDQMIIFFPPLKCHRDPFFTNGSERTASLTFTFLFGHLGPEAAVLVEVKENRSFFLPSQFIRHGQSASLVPVSSHDSGF